MPLDPKSTLEAIKEARERSERRNFVQSIELIVNLKDIDPKKPESRIRELIELPYPAGKENRICVFASGEMALKARRAGADMVMERSDLETLMGDKKRQKELAKAYDFFIAEAPLMPLVGRILGTTLGPRGRMPMPVPPTASIEEHIKRHRKMVLIRLRGQPVLQCRVGTEDMPDEQIVENLQAVMRRIERKLKRGIKNIRSVWVKTTMGPPVRVKM
ncbi:MAG: 50S ribosomal protein L1 [Candidatus Bathyarchaeia archaeon]